MEEKQAGIRINKYLSMAGICSRREADRELLAGHVKIDGRIATAGERVRSGEQVFYKGNPVIWKEEPVLLAVYKPRGIVCTAQKKEKDNIIDFLHYPIRVYPVGRLDKQSEGLILMTNEGDLVNKIMRAGNFHEKEYLVTVNKPLTESFLQGMSQGVPILELNTVTRKCQVERTGQRSFRIILTQGLNRQIRRMCEYFGYRVVRLKRVRIMNICLGELTAGQYRDVSVGERERLNEMIKNSRSGPAVWNV